MPQVNLPADGPLPSARQRALQKERWRRTEQEPKATTKEGDDDGDPIAVEDISAVESLSR